MNHIQVILYNSSRFIDGFIQGFNIVKKHSDFTIHFLENSNEDSKEYLKKLPINFDYTYDNEHTNFGFGKGHNFLFNKYKEKYDEDFIILNPDVLPFFDFLEKLEKFKMNINEDWGIIELTQFPEEHPKEFGEDFKTLWVSGAGADIKKKAFDKVNGFDENIFMYCEDVDLSWRVREENYNLYHAHNSKIAHITRNLDKNKDSSFEKLRSLAGGLYLRYKFFDEKEVALYKEFIMIYCYEKDSSEYNEIIRLYDEMRNKLSPDELSKYRSNKHKFISKTGEYAEHRWK